MPVPENQTDTFKVEKKCPRCKKSGTLLLRNEQISCSSDTCKFSVTYTCPLCDHKLDPSSFKASENDVIFKCDDCGYDISVRKIQYLVNNGLVVDHEKNCQFCNGPTIHRKSMNLGHRCFFFPKCSGQADLFGGKAEEITFLDFETTGLEVGRNEIIEIGALKIDGDGYEHTFQSFVKPSRELDPRISELTGITDTMLENAPGIRDSMTKLMNFLGSSKIVCHNADFDLPWLVTSCIRLGIPLKNNVVICTLKWARGNEEPRKGLGVLAKKYKIQHDNAHRALADSVTTKELYFIFESQNISQRPETDINAYKVVSKRILEKYASITA